MTRFAENLRENNAVAYRAMATATAMLSVISVMLSATMVNVAIPSIIVDFDISPVVAQWLSTGFLGSMTATMLMTGWASARLGTRRTIIIALLIFSLGSVLAALATDANSLIAARLIQGLAAGLVQPTTMVVTYNAWPQGTRGTAMGIYGVGIVTAPAIGPYVGGVLTDAASWRFMFLMMIPVALFAISAAWLFFASSKKTEEQRSFDWTGFLLLNVALFSVLTALSEAGQFGWNSNSVLWRAPLGLCATAAFVYVQLHSKQPLLDLRLFSNMPFVSASIIAFIMGGGLYGSVFILPLFAQTIFGMSPADSGLMLLPAGAVLAGMFLFVGRLVDSISVSIPIITGLIIFGISCLLLNDIDKHAGFWGITSIVVLNRFGLGMILPSLSLAALSVLSDELTAQGSGVLNFMRQLGGVFGVIAIAIIVEWRTIFHEKALTPEILSQLQAADTAGGETAAFYALTHGYQDGFLMVAILFFAALIPAVFYGFALRARNKKELAI